MKYRIDTSLVCKYGPQTVDLVPIILRTSPKFGEDRLILRFLAKILKKKKMVKNILECINRTLIPNLQFWGKKVRVVLGFLRYLKGLLKTC